MNRKRKNISAGTRWRVFERDGFCCVYCGAAKKDGAVLVIDHGDPFAKGGDDDESNYVTACKPCNAGKRDRIVIPQEAEDDHFSGGGEATVVGGIKYRNQLHADWADALKHACRSVAYMPHEYVVEDICSQESMKDVIRPEFLCESIDKDFRTFNVVIIPRCDVGAMSDESKARSRNAAILGYRIPTAIIMGSPWCFWGVLINERYKGCPHGFGIGDSLEALEEQYLSGWYPDESWEGEDFRDFCDRLKPACVQHRVWHTTICEAVELHEKEFRYGS